jgi:spermidine/putrescine-binding protein
VVAKQLPWKELRMKKLLLLLVLVLALTGCSKPSGNNNLGCSTLRVYNWGVYIGPNVKSDFEAKYNVKVIYDQFASNEEMYTKLLSGESYDVLYPSDYMVERLLVEKKLQAIDKSQLKNLGNLMDEVKGWDFDPQNEYSVPYLWGSVGLLYNTKNVSIDDLEQEGFNIMINPKYKGKIYVYDSERDSFMMALKALGYSMNTSKETEINAAYEWLKQVNSEMEPVYVTDDSIDNMINGLKDIALMYSGDAAYIISENPDMGYYLPSSGTNVWLDSMVIPADSQCVELAHAWIDYQLDPEVATANTLEVGYTTSVKSVYDAMIAEGGDFAELPAYQVEIREGIDEIFRYNEDTRKILSDLWTRVKAQ